MPHKVRTKQVITFADDGTKLPVGVLTVGKDLTKEQFDLIKDNFRFCEVIESSKPGPKPKPKPVEPEEPESE